MSKSKLKVVLNSAGVRALLRSPEIAAVCEQKAKAEAAKLGSAYKTDVYQGRNRVNVSVYTDDPDAIDDNLKHNTMLKSLGGQSNRTGRQVSGYWRTTKNGKRIYVQPYQRRR